MGKKNKWFSLVIIAIFMLAIFIPFTGAIFQEDKGLSYNEKRKLQELPSFPEKMSEVSAFIEDFEKYYNDQFGYREYFLGRYAAVKKLLGDHDISNSTANIGTKNVIKGRDNWFFLNRIWDGDPVGDYRNINLYGEADLLRSTLLLSARNDWLKNKGIEYLLFFAPNKHTIYSEFLPDYIKKVGDISALDQLNDALRRYTNVHFVDLREVLLQNKKEASKYWKDRKDEAALYYKKDSHWNSAGVDIAQYAIAEKLEEIFPGKITPSRRALSDFVMRAFAGDITLIMGGKEEEAYGPSLMGGTCTAESFLDYLQRNHVTLCPENTLDAVIFNDSFFPPLKPYFTDYFRRVAYYWEVMTLARVKQEINIKKPDIVIEERAERFLPFSPQTKGENYSSFWGTHWQKWKKVIYTLNMKEAGEGVYRSANVDLSHLSTTNSLLIEAKNNDPMIHLNNIDFKQGKLYIVKVHITSNQKSLLQLYYSSVGKEAEFPAESHSVAVPVAKGENTIWIPLFSMDLSGDLRFDPGQIKGRYDLHKLEIKEIDQVNLKD